MNPVIIGDATLYLGDCMEVMRQLPDASVDSIVCDPPYGLSKEPDMADVLKHWLAGDDYKATGGGFMGKTWDSFVPGPAIWREALRVLKPGGHLLAFFGSRTYDMGTLALRLAGFEIRDQIAWIYSSGFPKSMNLDRLRGKEICGCEEPAEQATECGLRSLRHPNVPKGVDPEAKCGKVLQSSLQEQGTPTQGRQQLQRTEIRCSESCMEGRCNTAQATRELCAGEIRPGTELGNADGSLGRIHHGTSSSDGDVLRVSADQDGSGASRQSRPNGQRPSQSGTVAEQQQPQNVGSWPICGRCSLPMVPKGLGTALKPAHEPICVARKPLIGTVAENVLAHGTGAINIDGCRVAADDKPTPFGNPTQAEGWRLNKRETNWQPSDIGRWPANVIHDGSGDVLAAFPDAPGQMADASMNSEARKTQNVYGDMRRGRGEEASADAENAGAVGFKMKPGARRLDVGSAARFFYCAKASKRDRDEGLSHMPTVTADPYGQHRGRRMDGNDTRIDGKPASTGKNNHPTVKPTDLMAYLCRLVTPPGGVVLDPFMGSGSTGKACMREGFRFIGIDMTPEYFEIARARIQHECDEVTQQQAEASIPVPQLDLFAGEAA